VAQLQLGLEKVRLEPLDGRVVQSVVDEGFGGRTSHAATRSDDAFVLLLDDGITDAGISSRHLSAAMAEDGHDRLNTGATFGELSAHRVAKAMSAYRRTTLAIDEPGLTARERQRFREQIAKAHGLATVDKHKSDEFAGRRIVTGGSIGGHA